MRSDKINNADLFISAVNDEFNNQLKGLILKVDKGKKVDVKIKQALVTSRSKRDKDTDFAKKRARNLLWL